MGLVIQKEETVKIQHIYNEDGYKAKIVSGIVELTNFDYLEDVIQYWDNMDNVDIIFVTENTFELLCESTHKYSKMIIAIKN